jgi:hypothetical protein
MEDALHEARALWQKADRRNDARIEQPEVADLRWQLDLRGQAKQEIEDASAEAADEAHITTRLADHVDDLIALAPFGEHGRQHLRWMLEIGIHHHNHIGGAMIEASSERKLLAEVSA